VLIGSHRSYFLTLVQVAKIMITIHFITSSQQSACSVELGTPQDVGKIVSHVALLVQCYASYRRAAANPRPVPYSLRREYQVHLLQLPTAELALLSRSKAEVTL
jgi:hypothetical protein